MTAELGGVPDGQPDKPHNPHNPNIPSGPKGPGGDSLGPAASKGVPELNLDGGRRGPEPGGAPLSGFELRLHQINLADEARRAQIDREAADRFAILGIEAETVADESKFLAETRVDLDKDFPESDVPPPVLPTRPQAAQPEPHVPPQETGGSDSGADKNRTRLSREVKARIAELDASQQVIVDAISTTEPNTGVSSELELPKQSYVLQRLSEDRAVEILESWGIFVEGENPVEGRDVPFRERVRRSGPVRSTAKVVRGVTEGPGMPSVMDGTATQQRWRRETTWPLPAGTVVDVYVQAEHNNELYSPRRIGTKVLTHPQYVQVEGIDIKANGRGTAKLLVESPERRVYHWLHTALQNRADGVFSDLSPTPGAINIQAGLYTGMKDPESKAAADYIGNLMSIIDQNVAEEYATGSGVDLGKLRRMIGHDVDVKDVKRVFFGVRLSGYDTFLPATVNRGHWADYPHPALRGRGPRALENKQKEVE